jgi:hypothetical protein
MLVVVAGDGLFRLRRGPLVARETIFDPAVWVATQDVRQTRSHAPIQRLSYATDDGRPSIVLEILLTIGQSGEPGPSP